MQWKGWRTTTNTDQWYAPKNNQGEGKRLQAQAEGSNPRIAEYNKPGRDTKWSLHSNVTSSVLQMEEQRHEGITQA